MKTTFKIPNYRLNRHISSKTCHLLFDNITEKVEGWGYIKSKISVPVAITESENFVLIIREDLYEYE